MLFLLETGDDGADGDVFPSPTVTVILSDELPVVLELAEHDRRIIVELMMAAVKSFIAYCCFNKQLKRFYIAGMGRLCEKRR